MAKIQVPVDVEKGAWEVSQAMVKLVNATRAALKDGFQPGQDIPAIMVEAFADLPVAVSGISNLGTDWTEDHAAFLKAWGLAGFDLLKPV